MKLSFNSDGNLHQTVELSFEEFKEQFGTNESRKEQIKNAVHNRHNKLGTIRKKLKCHIFTFNKFDQTMLRILSWDRNGHPKGMIKISFQNGFNYD